MASRFGSRIRSIFQGALPYIGAAAGGIIGGPTGAAAGYQAGGYGRSALESERANRRQRQQPYGQQPYGMDAMRGFNQQQPQMQQQQPQTTQYGRSTVQGLPDGARSVQSPLRTPEQEAMQKELGQMGMGALKNLPSSDFGPIEADYTRQYNEQTIPQLMEQFVGAAPGGMRTSGFQQALGSAGTGLASKLAAMKQQYNMQNRGQEQTYGLNLLRPGLQQQFQTDFLQPQPNDFAPMAGAQMQGNILGSLVERALGDQGSGNREQDDWIKQLIAMFASQMQRKGASWQTGGGQ